MIHTVNCPICNSKVKSEYYTGPYGLEEEYIYCPVCEYDYHFAYGQYLCHVKNKTFIWDYTTPTNVINKRLKRAHFMARRNWKKYRKKTTGDKKIPF